MKVVFADLDQLAAPEGAGDRQGRLAEDRHRDRAEVGRRRRLLRQRPRQPGHLRPLLGRRPDVHVDVRLAVPGRLHEPVLHRHGPGSRPGRQKSNNWSGRNFLKWKNEEYDKLFDQVLVEPNPEKAATTVAAAQRPGRQGLRLGPAGRPQVRERQVEGADRAGAAPFDNETWNIADWSRWLAEQRPADRLSADGR